MNASQAFDYYGSLAIRIGSNAVIRVMNGNVDEARELAKNAASMAFAALPELRENREYNEHNR